MLRIAVQTAGPIWLKFLVDTHGWPGGVFFHGQRRAHQLVSNKIINNKEIYLFII